MSLEKMQGRLSGSKKKKDKKARLGGFWRTLFRVKSRGRDKNTKKKKKEQRNPRQANRKQVLAMPTKNS